MRAPLSFVLVAATLATAAPVGAFHGTPYRVPGTGCVDGTTVCFPVVLE